MKLHLLLLFGALGASFTQAVCGFGFGMFLMAFLALVLPVPEAVPITSCMGLVVGCGVLWRWRKHLQVRNVLPLLGGAVLGVPLGVTFVTEMEERWVLVALGVLLLGYGVHALIREFRGGPQQVGAGGEEKDVPLIWGGAAGLAAGAIGGAFNMGGPPVVLYGAVRGWPQGVFIATLQTFFVSVLIYQLSLFALRGQVTTTTLLLAAEGLPAVALGLWGGARASTKINPVTFRRGLLVLLLILGAVFLVRAFR